MPRTTVRIARRKRVSLKKRTVVLGKGTKYARKNKSRRHIRMINGGASWITKENQGKLIHIWNSLFYERARVPLGNRLLTVQPVKSTSKTALFVIDMQLDFMDQPYERPKPTMKDEIQEVHPVGGGTIREGNFAVAQAGQELVDGIVGKVNEVLNVGGKVIFSRDYHPVGHSSFNKTFFYEPNLCGVCEPKEVCDDGGAFPAHCVQGKEGSKFVKEIQELIDGLKEKQEQVVIAFKGIHMNNDSYTAVDKENIDAAASNVKHTNCKGCSNVSGGFQLMRGIEKLDPKTASTFMGKFNETKTDPGSSFEVVEPNKEKTDLSLEQVKYDELIKDCDVIEVCGLAGDYCVRDTVVALARKFPDKKIVLLGDLTAYAALPFFSIKTVPQHVSEEKYKEDAYKVVMGDFNNMLDEALDINKKDKDITLYLMKSDENHKKMLLTKDEINNNPTTLKNDIVNEPTKLNYHHFITPHKEILDDYLPLPKVFIKITDKSNKPIDDYTKILKQSNILKQTKTTPSV